MGQVTVTLNGRTYRLRCGDGEEERLLRIAGHVSGHVERLTREHGQIGDERLILMAAILVTDELFELRETSGGTRARAPANMPSMPGNSPLHRPAPPIQDRISAPAQAPAAVKAHVIATAVPRAFAPVPGDTDTGPATSPTGKPSALDQLDATALMKGVEKKAGRS